MKWSRCSRRLGEIVFDEDRFAKPSDQNAIEHDASELGLFNADRLDVGLVIESATGVVVSR